MSASIRGALVAGHTAYALAVVVDRYEIAKRLDACGASPHLRAQVLDVLDAIDLEAETWRSTQAPHIQPLASASGIRNGQPPEVPSTSNAMTCSQAAAQLKVSTRQVRALAAAGRLPGRRHGRDWLLERAGVNAYAATRAKETRR